MTRSNRELLHLHNHNKKCKYNHNNFIYCLAQDEQVVLNGTSAAFHSESLDSRQNPNKYLIYRLDVLDFTIQKKDDLIRD